jgi:hypothetical protein
MLDLSGERGTRAHAGTAPRFERESGYYTPMACEIAADILKPRLTVYDCMDELSALAGAPAKMKPNEESLFRTAELVFTGGASLYEVKRMQHVPAAASPRSTQFPAMEFVGRTMG